MINNNITLLEAISMACERKGFAKERDLPRIDFVKIKSNSETTLTSLVVSGFDEQEYKVLISTDENKKNVKIFPKVDSTAFVLKINQSNFFVNYSELEKVVIGDGSKTMGVIKIEEQETEINTKIKDKINEIISFLNSFVTNFNSHVHTCAAPSSPSSPPTVPFADPLPSNSQGVNKDNYKLEAIEFFKYD